MSSWRMRALARLIVSTQIGAVVVDGAEYLDDARLRGGVVIATTHITDLDMPVVVDVLASHVPLRIANMSLHHSVLTNVAMSALLSIAGAGNFFPIDYLPGKPPRGSFNPENYRPMAESIRSGSAVMIAAHRPMSTPQLPERGGLGAVYLAGVTGAPILPVAVSIPTDGSFAYTNTVLKTMLVRPTAYVFIGEPFHLGALTPATRVTRDLVTELGHRSARVMAVLRNLLSS